MGTIQNAVNQGLGTIAGALATGKYLKEQRINNEINAANTLAEAEPEAKRLEDEQTDLEMKIQETETNLEAAQKEYENQTPEERLMNEIAGTGPASLDKDLYYQKRSLDNVSLKLRAKQMQIQRSRDVLKHRLKGVK